MKIAIIKSISPTGVCRDTKIISSGYQNIAHCLDDQMYFHADDIKNKEYDIVLCTGTETTLNWLLKNGKPTGWGKLIFLQAEGSWILNAFPFIDKVCRINFDAIALTCQTDIEQYKIFGKPVFIYNLPYPFKKYEHLKKISKIKKVCINIKKFDNNFVNHLGTLRAFQLLPKIIKGVVAVNPAYTRYHDQLVTVINGLKLNNRIEVMESSHPDKYLQKVADCKVFLSMDLRYTCGRFQTDAMAVGSIAVGTASQGQYMFSKYMVNPKEIKKASEFVLKAFNDNSDYSYMRESFTYDFFKRKLYYDMEDL